MTHVGFLAGAAVIAVMAWLALPVVALVVIVRDKVDRLVQMVEA